MFQRVTLLFFLSFLVTPVLLFGQDHKKVDCNAQFQFAKTKFGFTADVLSKIKVGLNLDPQVLAQLDKWTSVALDQQRALCDSYRASSEAQFPTDRYLTELEKLRNWDLDFLKIVVGSEQICSKAGTKAGKSDLEKLRPALTEQIQELLKQPPKADIPDTAVRPDPGASTGK